MKRFELTGWKGAVASWYVIATLASGFVLEIVELVHLITHFL